VPLRSDSARLGNKTLWLSAPSIGHLLEILLKRSAK